MFISFEGPEGGGKTTQSRRLAESLRSEGYVVVPVYEPGGTPIGDAIRALLLSPDHAPNARTEALLFAAARAQLVDEVLGPALSKGAIVISDRFSDSTIAYQVGGRGLPRDAVDALIEFATAGVKPDLTFLLDVAVATGFARKRQTAPDRMEQADRSFHERVRDTYLALANAEPNRIVRLNATQSVAELTETILTLVHAKLSEGILGTKGEM
ncbi:MAG TPA: dTMP kinase [Chloroflexota bacterium]|nr:dTMP kinase [Chloroflexota bacterium]